AKFRPLFQVPQQQLSIQPIYDEMVDRYTTGRLALIGDAATLTRPHTGSGATKAMQDARLIEELGAEHHNWALLLDAYDTDRSAEGARLVDVGRRIGRDQVEQTPPWADMTPADFTAWAAGTLGDDQLYFWGTDETESTTR
ncbi:FAD-dependent monooxygenase, partial [Ilumatobacter sp.]|uniref:FAD-dependent monooxygenase n=1 Tax=Ilumatobacter sp. TaxID=1967498 RepID=UPI003AF85C92